MDLPFFISGEAILWAKDKAKHKSIFNPEVPITSTTRKFFLPDPKVVKQAISKLKEAGFTVTGVNKTSIGIAAPIFKFEESFAIQLKIESNEELSQHTIIAQKGDKKSLFIEAKGSEFSDYFDAIILAQLISSLPDEMPSSILETPQKNTEKGQLLSWEIPQMLNDKLVKGETVHKNKDNKWPYYTTGKDIDIGIIDSHFSNKHPFFKTFMGAQPFKGNFSIKKKFINLSTKPNNDWLEYFQGWQAEIGSLSDKEPDKIDTLLSQRINQVIAIIIERRIAFEGVNIFKTEAEALKSSSINPTNDQTEISKIIKGLRGFGQAIGNIIEEIRKRLEDSMRYAESRDHGTAVVSNLLSIAPEVNIDFWDMYFDNNYSDLGTIFTYIASQDYRIISCSWQSDRQDNSDWKADEDKINLWRNEKVKTLIDIGTHVLFAAGNAGKNKSVQAMTEPAGAIIVGGAYKEGDKITASNDAHGYEEAGIQVPTLSAWCGSKEKFGEIVVPYKEDKWTLQKGTSFSTPQVAGVCARMLEIWPEASPAIVKKNLMETADKVLAENGVSAQDNPPSIATGAGMVNIKNALLRTLAIKTLVSITPEKEALDTRLEKLDKGAIKTKMDHFKTELYG